MIKGREVTTASFTALAVLACLGAKADAAQCGSTGAGFEAWKGQFAEEAREKGVGASSVAALFDWAADQLGPIDILVNNAGVSSRTRLMSDMSPGTRSTAPPVTNEAVISPVAVLL